MLSPDYENEQDKKREKRESLEEENATLRETISNLLSYKTENEDEISLLRLKIAELERQNSDLAAKNCMLEKQLLTAKLAFC